MLDFSASFVYFTTLDLGNTARIQVESRCRVLGRTAPRDFFLFASCKSEHTYALDRLFQDPNYDFCGIFAADTYRIFRSFASFPDNRHESGLIAKRFHEVLIKPVEHPTLQPARSADEIIVATLENRPIAGQTEFTLADGRTRVVVDYPIKTMNVNRRTQMWQVDTGPILLPDLQAGPDVKVEAFRLAYVAYNNKTDFAEFVIHVATPFGSGGAPTNHYSERLQVKAANRVFVP